MMVDNEDCSRVVVDRPQKEQHHKEHVQEVSTFMAHTQVRHKI
jgi:hypothetical protein